MRKLIHYLAIILSIVSGLVLFLSIPRLFFVEGTTLYFGLEPFLEALKLNFKQFSKPDISHIVKQWSTTSIKERYFYTLRLVGLTLILSIFTGILFSSIYVIVTRKARSFMKNLLNFSESIPDLMVIFTFQFSVILLYKETGLKFFRLYGLNEEPFLIHILTASFLPGFFMAQFLIKQLDEEFQRDYVIFAKSKGIPDIMIYFRHILRNILPITFVQIRTVLWVILSNIVLIEYIFVLDGFTQDLSKIFYTDTLTAVFNCILIAVPIILIEFLIRVTLNRGREDVAI